MWPIESKHLNPHMWQGFHKEQTLSAQEPAWILQIVTLPIGIMHKLPKACLNNFTL